MRVLVCTHTCPRTVWLGATDEEVEGNWIEYDDTIEKPLCYLPWGEGEPNGGRNENCLGLFSSTKYKNQWNDFPCGNKYNFICSVKGDIKG